MAQRPHERMVETIYQYLMCKGRLMNLFIQKKSNSLLAIVISFSLVLGTNTWAQDKKVNTDKQEQNKESALVLKKFYASYLTSAAVIHKSIAVVAKRSPKYAIPAAFVGILATGGSYF